MVEDEPKDYTSFHQLPRLACISLPTQPSIIFTDYLFEGDSKKDSQESFKDLLSIQVDEGFFLNYSCFYCAFLLLFYFLNNI